MADEPKEMETVIILRIIYYIEAKRATKLGVFGLGSRDIRIRRYNIKNRRYNIEQSLVK
jgi:hypothetical protein